MTEERELSLALPRSHADVRQDEVEDLAEKIRSILFGRACWLPYQEADVEALPEQDPFGAKLLESLQAMETAVLEQHLRSLFPSLTTRSGPGRDTEITGRRRDVEKCRRNVDVLLAMADEDPSVFKPNPQNPCQAERTVSRLRLRRFAVNWLLYRPSALPKPKPPADKRRYIDDCLHLKLGEKDDGGGGGSGQMAPGYQLKRFPVIIRFWDHLVSFVQHFRHGLEALEQSLISTPSDINAGLTVSGQPRPVGGPDWASDATLSVVDILHERTEAGKSQRAVGLRSTVLFFQLIKDTPPAGLNIALTPPISSGAALEKLYPTEYQVTPNQLDDVIKGLILIGPSALSNDVLLRSLWEKLSPSSVFEAYLGGGHQRHLGQQCAVNPALVRGYLVLSDCVRELLINSELRRAHPLDPHWQKLRARTIVEQMDQPLEELKEFVICTKEENAEKPLEWQTLRTLRKAHVENEVCLRRRPVADATVSLLQAEAAGTDALFKALVSHPGPGEHCPSAREAFLKERDCVRARRVETVSRLGKALGSRLPLPDVAAEWAAVTRPGRARLVDHSVQEIARDGRGGEDDEEEGEDEGPDPSRLGAAYALASSGWPSLRAPDGQSAISSIQVDSAWLHPAFPERVEHVTYIPTTEIRSLVLRLQGRAEPFLVPVHARNMVWVEAALSWLVEGAVLADMVAPQERGAEPWCHKHPSAVSTTVGVISLVDPAGPPLPADVRSRFEAGPVVLTHGLAREQDVLEVALAGSTILTVFDQALADNGPAPSSQKAITCLSELEERAKHDRKKAFLYTWDVPSGDLELQAASQLRSLSMDAVAWAATRHIAERDGTMGGSSLARPRMRRLLLLTPGAIVGHDAGGLCAPHGACLHLTVLRGSLLLFFSLGGAAELAAGHGERRGGQYAWKELLPGDEAYFPPGTLLTAVAGGGRPEEQAAAETAEMAVAEFGYFFSPLHLYNTVLTKAVLSGRDLATFPAEEACPAVEEALLLYVWKEVHWRREALEGRENSLMKLNRPAFEARFGNKHTFPADLIGLASLVYMNTISPAQLAPMGLSDAGVTSLVASWNMRRVACTNDLIVMCFGSYVDFYKYWAPRFLGPNMTLLRLHIEGDLGPTGDRGSSRQAKEAAGSETEAGQEFEAMANMLRLKLQKYERPGLEACMTGTLRGRADPPGGEPAQTRVPTGVGLKTPASQRGAGVMSVGGDTDLGLPSPPQTDRREGGEGVGRTASTGPATSNLSGSTAMTSRKRPRDLDPHSPTAQLDEARKRRKNVAEQHTAVSVRVR